MKVWTQEQLVKSLEKEGLHFSAFSLVHEGEYTVDDADWNYKDVPHLHHVHNLVEAIFGVMSDKFIATVNIQSILGIKLPMAVVNYESDKNTQTYFTTWLFFALIVQTKYEAMAKCITRVTTTYNIGSPWILKWSFPIIRWLIKRNYKDLMSTDIPMRERRGELRRAGYAFYKETESYSFPKTMEILKENVIPPTQPARSFQIQVDQVLAQAGEYFYGDDDHLGLRLVRKDDNLYIFSRLCMHEGASLDKSTCTEEMKLKCPWHGRLHAPIAQFSWYHDTYQTIETRHLRLEFNNHLLKVYEINLLESVV